MFFIGTGFSSAPAHFETANLSQLAARIREPEPWLRELIKTLRNLRSIDPETYRKRKTALPWFIGATFLDQVRKAENLVCIEHFVLDIDHCLEHGHDPKALVQRLKDDPEVALAFVSPGGDGVKCVFTLDGRIEQPKVFSDFYRVFTRQFSARYGLEAAVDAKTFDVARVCFVSHDPGLWLNEKARPVVWKGISPGLEVAVPEIPFGNGKPMVIDLGDVAGTPEKTGGMEPGKELMKEIRKVLQPQPVRPPAQVMPPMPQRLRDAQPGVLQALLERGITVVEMKEIQYGLKLHLGYGGFHAEVNVFYGKQGFSVVPVPKSGTHPELNTLVCEIIHGALYPPADFTALQ
jgi:hypothetical protein